MARLVDQPQLVTVLPQRIRAALADDHRQIMRIELAEARLGDPRQRLDAALRSVEVERDQRRERPDLEPVKNIELLRAALAGDADLIDAQPRPRRQSRDDVDCMTA